MNVDNNGAEGNHRCHGSKRCVCQQNTVLPDRRFRAHHKVATLQIGTTGKTQATCVQHIRTSIPKSHCNSRPAAGVGRLASSGGPELGVDGMVSRETNIDVVVRLVVIGPSSSPTDEVAKRTMLRGHTNEKDACGNRETAIKAPR